MAHVPMQVKSRIKAIMMYCCIALLSLWKSEDSANQPIKATMLPAVPGPHGQKPLPNPVPINIGMSGGRLSEILFLLFIVFSVIFFFLKRKINRKNLKYQNA